MQCYIFDRPLVECICMSADGETAEVEDSGLSMLNEQENSSISSLTIEQWKEYIRSGQNRKEMQVPTCICFKS